MKKLIIAAVLLSALLVSCGSTETKDPFFEDYYFFPGIDRGAQTIMKLNVTTGSITRATTRAKSSATPPNRSRSSWSSRPSRLEPSTANFSAKRIS